MVEMVIIFIICYIATTIGAISGIGGGVIIKPMLDALTSMSVSEVSFLSGCTVLAMTCVALFNSKEESRNNPTKNTTKFALAIGASIGGMLGNELFNLAKEQFKEDNHIGLIQNILLVLMMLIVIVYSFKKQHVKTKDVSSPIWSILIGMSLGIISSFIGIGGGPLNLVVLHYFYAMDTKIASLNSIFIILLSQATSLVFTILLNNIPDVQIQTLIIMVIAGSIGGFAGRKIAKRINVKQLDRLFLMTVVLIIFISIWNITKFA